MAANSRTLWPELKGACLLGFALMMLLSFATYDPHDPTPWFSTGAIGEPRNWIGRYGAFISELFLGQGFGIAAFVLPLGLLVAGWRLLWREELDAAVTKSVGLVALLLSTAGFAFIALKTVPFSGEPIRAGGAVGEAIALFLSLRVGRFGAVVVLGLSLFTGLILTTQFSFSAFLTSLVAWIAERITAARVAFAHWRETRRKDQLRQQVIRKHAARTQEGGEDEQDLPVIDPAEARFIDLPLHETTSAAAGPTPARTAEAPRPVGLVFDPISEPEAYPVRSNQSITGTGHPVEAFARPFEDLDLRPATPVGPSSLGHPDEDLLRPAPIAVTPVPPPPSVVPIQSSMIPNTPGPASAPPGPPIVEAPSRAALRRKREPLSPEVQNARSAVKRGRFALPPLSLLDPTVAVSSFDRTKLTDRARVVEAKCKEFGVAGAIVEIHPGPVVTTYEFKPDAGVKYAKVVSLADDLALALEAESVRIDRMGGRGTVGIEIPNEEREMIGLRAVLDSDLARRSSARLLIGLGKNVAGDTYIADLATMPHLLIAGATGTGKSVGLNCIIASLLFHTTPDECRLIMIDPKRLELGVYEGIPHLLAPVVTEPKLAANVLKWAVGEMDKRTRILAAEGVRNIEQFNNIIKSDGEAESGLTPLHYIVIVIDELADLMMVSSKEVEESITRLAQMARAVGIHLILATQRPSVDVITGLIKANFPARISFRVSARVDSRTILDASGAEQLLGRGDMLFLPPQSSRLVRVHGAYVSEKEIGRITEFLRTTGEPTYDTSVGKTETSAAEKARAEDRDDLFDECARLVVEQGQASTSMLQRRFRIGFSRAGRLIDLMEQDGIIGPADGARPREILVPKNYFSEVDSRQS
ncbi:MAG: DNA translocase FtsK [Vicinamibacteria bacterium]|nr:DNA translocase FtsK [Vicinamibacteria bacterium]